MSEDYINLDRTIEEYEKLVYRKERILADIIKSTSIPAVGIFSREVEIEMLKIAIVAMKEKRIRENIIIRAEISRQLLNDRGNYLSARVFKTQIRNLRECEVKK